MTDRLNSTLLPQFQGPGTERGWLTVTHCNVWLGHSNWTEPLLLLSVTPVLFTAVTRQNVCCEKAHWCSRISWRKGTMVQRSQLIAVIWLYHLTVFNAYSWAIWAANIHNTLDCCCFFSKIIAPMGTQCQIVILCWLQYYINEWKIIFSSWCSKTFPFLLIIRWRRAFHRL